MRVWHAGHPEETRRVPARPEPSGARGPVRTRGAGRSGVRLPLLFLVATLAARLPVLLAHLDTWFPFEVHCGTIAVALTDGLDLDWATLPIIGHIRGNVVNGLLLVPLYAAFGASAPVMKLVPLAWHAVTVALLVHLLARHAGRRAAVAAGVLFVLGPPALQKLSVLGLASHLESMLFFLLALWPWLEMTSRRRCGPVPAFLFGAAVGCAGFFHVQALLPCLVLLGLLLAAELPALLPWGLPALVAGLALCAAPALAFDGGGLHVLEASLSVGLAEEDAAGDAAGGSRTPLGKLAGLARSGLADSLEYSDLPGPAGRALGVAVAALLAAGAALAAWQERRAIADLARRVLLRRPGRPPGPVPPLALHVLLLLASYAVSHAFTQTTNTSGMANRHLAPLWFSLLALAGLALGRLADAGRLRLARGLLAALALPGAAGLVAASLAPPGARLAQRGECYEWFRSQLVHASGGRETPATVELIARVDRGDPRFRNLRFRVCLVRTPLDDPHVLEKERLLRRVMPPEVALFAATHLGRQLAAQFMAYGSGGTLPRLRDPQALREVDALPARDEAALLHGVGLELEPPRIGEDPSRADRFLQRLTSLLHRLPPRQGALVAEGYGFGRGAVFDPHSQQARHVLRLHERLPPDLQDAFYTGLGWGIRQRYLDPPGHLPEGLPATDCIPPNRLAAFERGFTCAVLPCEAQAPGD